MIEEEFVTFDTAKMLKEIGFDIPINTSYSENGNFEYDIFPDNFNKLQDKFSRPTQALAARWLREIHHIDIVVDVINENEYCCDIFQNKQRKSIAESVNSSFEEVFEDGLKYALKLIKSNNYGNYKDYNS